MEIWTLSWSFFFFFFFWDDTCAISACNTSQDTVHMETQLLQSTDYIVIPFQPHLDE